MKVLGFWLLIITNLATAKSICETIKYLRCRSKKVSRWAQPTETTASSINPSAVSTRKGFGVEILNYKGSYDFAYVTGTGKAGASLSNQTPDNLFFGNFDMEPEFEYRSRFINGEKFESPKTTLATAINLISSKKSTFNLKYGIIGKYHKTIHEYRFGQGATVSWNRFYLAWSEYKDDTIDSSTVLYLNPIYRKYTVSTYSAGILLPHVAIDYSYIESRLEKNYTVKLLTLNFFINHFSINWGSRIEKSPRLKYDFDQKTFSVQERKQEYFLGLLFKANKNFHVGIFNNYYLLRSTSLAMTIFI